MTDNTNLAILDFLAKLKSGNHNEQSGLRVHLVENEEWDQLGCQR